MLMADGLLKSLADENPPQECQAEDYDFGDVLENVFGNLPHEPHKIRYADGKEHNFSWD